MNQLTFLTDGISADQGFTMACGERPQERMENFGVTALSDTELIAMLLQGGGTRTEGAVAMASQLIAEAGSIAGLASWVAADYRKLKGIGRSKGLQLAAMVEISRRMMSAQRDPAPLLNRPELITAYMVPIASGLAVEKFWVLCLNRKSRLIKRVEISSGTATAALAHPREVFRAAVRESASAIVCIHNHPSGDPAPSAPDLHVTRQLREAARAVDVDLLDHVILGRREADPLGVGFYSFRQSGML
jgi:DNA repair protein RadC